MNATEAEIFYRRVDPVGLRKLVVGWLTEGTGALGAAVMCVLGLAGIFSTGLAAIAAMALGAALLCEAVALAACFSDVTPQDGRRLEWGGAITVKFVGGTAVLVIGCLVLLGLATPSLLPVVVLVLGPTFLFTSMVSVMPGTQEIIGACTFIVGALALMGLHSLTLVLAALLVLSLMALFNGAASERSLGALVPAHDFE